LHRRYESEDVAFTIDSQLQYHFKIGSRQDLVAGAGYRLSDNKLTGLYEVFFVPDHRHDSLFSVFLQDEIALTRNLALTLGTKLEHNAFTGFEYEPSAQLVWTPKDRQSLWFSAARAIRQPSMLDENVQIDVAVVPLANSKFGVVEILGNPQLEAETLLNYELGYRNQVNRRTSFDVTAFFSDYQGIRTTQAEASFFTVTPGPPHLVIPEIWANLAGARDYGVELSGSWDVTSRWRISPGFSFLRMNINPEPVSTDTANPSRGYAPQQQAQIRSSVKLSHRVEWDTTAYFVGALSRGPVPAYTRLDTRLGWTMGESVYFSVGGQNLLSPRHFEFLDGHQIQPTEVERSVVGKVTWRF
jgi:iron complex outermembrane recepter protein